VSGGVARCAIVVPSVPPNYTPRGGRTIEAAANDLAYHFEMMSGAQVPIVDDQTATKGVRILLSTDPKGVQLPVDLSDESKFWPDGYVIIADEHQVVLAAPRIEGVSNAVYDLLEDHLGCYWFGPGRMGEHIPYRPTVHLRLAGGFEIVQPDRDVAQPWYSRARPLGPDLGETTVPEQLDIGKWMRRNRYSGLRGYWGHYWALIYTP